MGSKQPCLWTNTRTQTTSTGFSSLSFLLWPRLAKSGDLAESPSPLWDSPAPRHLPSTLGTAIALFKPPESHEHIFPSH